jgi:hypothetical protein
MRRFFSIGFVAGCCVVSCMGSSHVLGNDQQRTSEFRALTNEHPQGPVLTSASEAMPQPVRRLPAVAKTHAEPRIAQASPPPEAIGAGSPVYVQPAVTPARRPVGFYAGASAQSTLSQFPRRAPAKGNAPRQIRRTSKPFTNVEHEPTVSPWLNMDQDEDDTEPVPNYLTLVRPQLQQLQTNRVQQRELLQLRGQVQGISAVGAPPQYEASRGTAMGSPSRYMDTAQFYGGMR